ncbi:MAG: nucleotidyltransferase family protein [Ignavibacteriae bacterium]|nr:nucleotidyltransferase family protein [Ignavibacteriota bacterium]
MNGVGLERLGPSVAELVLSEVEALPQDLGRIEGIILAAGASSRAGCFKMELPLGDKTLIERSIDGMSCVCSRIVVVGGFRVDRVRELLGSYANVEVIENENWRNGMFSSVQLGAASVISDRVFLLPADIPLVPPAVYVRLLAEEGEILVPSFKGRRGHPILINKSVCQEILSEPKDSSLRNIIRRIGFKAVPVVHQEILIDVDSSSDFDSIVTHLRELNATENAT